jgi:Rod binding domain-containing protein
MSVIASFQTATPLAPTETAAAKPQRPDPELLEAARQFEAIFVRQLMAPMEKSRGITGQNQPGSDVYGSMITGALADAATQGDGLGLSALVLESLSQKLPSKPAPTEPERPVGQDGIAQ